LPFTEPPEAAVGYRRRGERGPEGSESRVEPNDSVESIPGRAAGGFYRGAGIIFIGDASAVPSAVRWRGRGREGGGARKEANIYGLIRLARGQPRPS